MSRATLMALALACGACGQIVPTPDEFPPPPATLIVDFPTPARAPTPAPRPRVRPLLESDMNDARAFFLVTKTAAVAGDDQLIAERILYPIQVKVNGQMTTIASATEFVDHYAEIFDAALLQTLWNADEDAIQRLPDGIRAANGLLWFNRFCIDAACTQTEFLITQINN